MVQMTQKSVYNGPFKLNDWKVEDKLQLSKNKDYWDKKAVHLDHINYKVLKDQQVGHHYLIQIL